MTFIQEKKINGIKRKYLEKSIRLPNGEVKKYSVYIKDKPLKEYEQILDMKVNSEMVDFYKKNSFFTEENVSKLENIKTSYKNLVKKLSKKQWEDVLDRFAINFTYESNAIEGNSLTLKDVTFVIKEGKIVGDKDLREVYETINTRKALEWVFNGNCRINEKNILKLHEIVVKNTGVSFGYKKIPNFLIGRNVETVSPENVKEEMDKLFNWHKNEKKIHPLEKAAIFHGKFEKIHPFEDGNGRVGRLIVNMILLENKYPPLIIRKSKKISYFAALEAFDNNHKDKLFRFFIEGYKKTFTNFFEVYMKYLI